MGRKREKEPAEDDQAWDPCDSRKKAAGGNEGRPSKRTKKQAGTGDEPKTPEIFHGLLHSYVCSKSHSRTWRSGLADACLPLSV